MPDLMADAASFLADELADNLSQTVTYKRGSLTVPLAMTKCPIRTESDGQANLDFEPCDWIVKASSLVLNSVAIEPQKKDVIIESDGQRWRVLPLDNEPEFRPVDPFRTMFRIHTKRTDEAD